MLAYVKKGNQGARYQFDHQVDTTYPDRVVLELSGVVTPDGRKTILTLELPADADEVFIMNDGGKTVAKYAAPKTPAEMRHANG